MKPHGPVPITTGRFSRPDGAWTRWRVCDRVVAGVRRRADMRVVLEAREQSALVAHLGVDRIDELDRGLLARVPGPTEYMKIQEISRFHAEPHRHCRPKCVFRMVQRQPQLGDPHHCLFGSLGGCLRH